MQKKVKIAALGVLTALGACTGSTNPEEASLFDNIHNLNTGEYDRQIESNKARAQAILANNRAAESRISGLENQAASNSRTIASLRNDIAETKAVAQQARASSAGDTAAIQRVSVLEQQLRSVESEVKSGTASPSVAKAELRRIRSALLSI
ncbi:hypothetical protein [Leisingera sp. S232]|uniref:hypothetical protein n=1 Tax=Leisingera sp. S232 TaxID=3415132 RepID=UPI003C7A3073